MALNASLLATTMLSQFESSGKLTGMDTAAKNKLKADWEFMYGILFQHIATNAVVSTTVNTTVVGTSPSGPVTGTGTGSGIGTIA